MYAEAFEAAGALDKLEAFASFYGADLYGLPRHTDTITLVREDWVVPESLPFGEAEIKPLRGGETSALAPALSTRHGGRGALLRRRGRPRIGCGIELVVQGRKAVEDQHAVVHHDVEPVDESTLGPGARQTQQGAVEGRCGQLQLDAMAGEVGMQELQQDQHVRPGRPVPHGSGERRRGPRSHWRQISMMRARRGSVCRKDSQARSEASTCCSGEGWGCSDVGSVRRASSSRNCSCTASKSRRSDLKDS